MTRDVLIYIIITLSDFAKAKTAAANFSTVLCASTNITFPNSLDVPTDQPS